MFTVILLSLKSLVRGVSNCIVKCEFGKGWSIDITYGKIILEINFRKSSTVSGG